MKKTILTYKAPTSRKAVYNKSIKFMPSTPKKPFLPEVTMQLQVIMTMMGL